MWLWSELQCVICMPSFSNKPFFKIVDVETSGLSPGHKKTALIQLYSSNLSPYQGARPFDPRTLIKPATGYREPRTGNQIQFTFNFSEGQNVLSAAKRVGMAGEEESVGRFFASAEEELSTKRRFIMGGWNPRYDTGVLETITQRYPSLEKYSGFFQRKGVKVLSLEKPFLELAHGYGIDNPTFSTRYLRMGPSTPVSANIGPGMVARSAEEMKYVPGWSVENITKAAGGRERLIGALGQFHEAVTDVTVEQNLFEKFRLAKRIVGRGYSYDTAMHAAGLLPEGATAETFFTQVFSSSWAGYLAKQAEKGIAVTPPKPSVFAGAATKVLLVAAIASVAYALATSKRSDRQTQITGLSDTGLASELRHKDTDFGSGWQGGEDRRSLRTAETLFIGAAAFAGHKWALQNWSGYAEGLYHTFQKIEARSPSELFRTFGLSQLQSSYLVSEVTLHPEQLFFGRELTETGKQVQRLIGINPLDKFEKTGMRFVRTRASSPYLELEGMPGFSIRFAERGRLTASSARMGMDLRTPIPQRIMGDTFREQMRSFLSQKERGQYLRSPLPKREAFKLEVGGEQKFFHPLFGRKAGVLGGIESAADLAERLAFESAERPLRLLGNIGLGLEYGTYNKLFHIPFIGEGGLLNKLMMKRVLPIYGAVTLARYLNYKLDNKPAETVAALPLKAHLAWAQATEAIPGLRAITDKYEEIVPGPQYGPLALPIGAGVASVVLGHYLPIARGTAEYAVRGARAAASKAAFRKGAKWGLLAMLPFVPGMLGSRQTPEELRRIYSGEEEVPVRAGRWWDVGSTPFRGGRVKYFRPHWYPLMQAKSEMIATYGSEDAYWEHHPLLHPFKYIKDPYWVERANYASRPYPITSPAFSNVPLVGHVLAATIGRVVKPPVRMHEQDWDINNYTLYSPRLEPKEELGGLPPAIPREEFSFKDVAKREAISFAEYTGLPGFLAMTLYGKVGPGGTPGEDVVLQGSRQLTNWSRLYYQRELGALSGFNPVNVTGMPYGYSEPLRRFIQPERVGVQANEIPNTMPHWLPGADYMVDFRTGDPFAKIPEGAVRLPGPGYAALHPELQDLKPEAYPDITRYKILADIAPYSKEYMIYKARIREQSKKDTRLAIEFARTEEQVRQIKESTIQFDQRRFTLPTENIRGTIKRATAQGVELEEYPGRTFTLSSLGMTASDLSALTLGEQNNLSRSQTAHEVDRRQAELQQYFGGLIGQPAELVVPVGTEEHAKEARAVLFVDDVNVNKTIIDKGLAVMRKDLGGAEAQAMFTSTQQALGKYAETLAFTGEGGPLRFIPTPFHTKYWNERTALALYQEQEVYGSRMRRWQRPFHDMVAPWARGIYRRVTGEVLVPEEVQRKREIDSFVDELDYLRGYIQAAAHPEARGRYTSQTKRTNIGGNLFGSPTFVATTLPRREKLYFQAFLQETDPKKRQQILESVSPDLARALTAQWVKTDAIIARAAGREVPAIEQGGMLYTEKGLKEYEKAKTDLSYSNYIRSKEIAETFGKLGFNLPGPGSPIWSEGLDYEDVKLKIVQNEGYDYHDFNIYDDRAALLWRKPYVDGAVRELTSGGDQSTERIRQTVERIIMEGQDKNPGVVVSTQANRTAGSNVSMDIDEQGDKAVMQDIRRNPESYREETIT